ncbi:hypothetical protein [Massilioclostridium coli]|uniref:hypothetical protein n=1 Tax=Massilioclostridium coli TaxID=1870991 RepID=UPI0022E8A92A|nr:hypothetical protein [Massilioclostridium coli]
MNYGEKFCVQGLTVYLYRYTVAWQENEQKKQYYCISEEEAHRYAVLHDNSTVQPIEVNASDEWIDGITIPNTKYPMEKAIEIYQAGENAWLNSKYIPSVEQSTQVLASILLANVQPENDTQKLELSGLYPVWVEGNHPSGDICNARGQTWECYQSHDTATYPDITPDNPAWYTFWRPLHGTSPETARPFVPVQGSHDMYRTGEYAIWEDGNVYRCRQDTNFSPGEYPQAWEVVK